MSYQELSIEKPALAEWIAVGRSRTWSASMCARRRRKIAPATDVPAQWEGDLIKGKGNASAVGTLVERSTGYLMLVRMHDAIATSAVEGFGAALNRMPLDARKTPTYDQGRELARHAEITQRTGVAVDFCDPHSPWQRGSNGNINGLIRQYLPKGTDLSGVSQEQLDAIAYELNIRPRQRFDYQYPIEMMTQMMAKHHEDPSLTQ